MLATEYNVSDAIQMLHDAGVDPEAEAKNPAVAYLDICEEITRRGGVFRFTRADFVSMLESRKK